MRFVKMPCISVENNLMFYYIRIIVISIVLLTVGCITPLTSKRLIPCIKFARGIPQNKVSFPSCNSLNSENSCLTCTEYKVKSGDTFYSLYCTKTTRMVSYNEFIELNNHIKNINSLEPGDSLYFPVKKTALKSEKNNVLSFMEKEYIKLDGSKFLLYIAKINPAQYKVHMYYGKGITIEDIKKSQKTVAAINGGFFAPGEDFHPIGLLISRGKKINPLTDYWDNSGIFYITTDPKDPYGICKKECFYDTDVTEALQSFPILIWNKKPYKEYKDREEASRSAIGLDSKGNILLIATESTISGGLTLNEFARAISTAEWDCERALNLDGGSSTQMYIKGKLSLHSTAGLIGHDRVSNFIVVQRER